MSRDIGYESYQCPELDIDRYEARHDRLGVQRVASCAHCGDDIDDGEICYPCWKKLNAKRAEPGALHPVFQDIINTFLRLEG